MATWKISFETLMEIREAFFNFTQEVENAIYKRCEIDIDESKYCIQKQRKEFYYITEAEFRRKLDDLLDHAVATKNKRLHMLQETIDNFNFFIDVVEFNTFTSADFGHDVIIDFYKCTIERVRNYEVPNNRFRVFLKGIKWTVASKYNFFNFSPENIRIIFDREG